jgi:adenylyltransferase/sulfurtransferase
VRALVVGIGGLGCPAAIALARAGVGVIGIADDDEVELTNLHRQILFSDDDIGKPKLECAARALRKIAPDVRVEEHATRLLPKNAIDLVSRYDVVLEGADNFPTKFLAADACRLAQRPIVHAAAVRWHGTALAVSARGQPCYRCLFEDVPHESVPNCDTAGVVGPMVGVVAAAQADLALSILAGREREVSGMLFTFDGKTLASRRRRVGARPSCALCGDARTIRDIQYERYSAPRC